MTTASNETSIAAMYEIYLGDQKSNVRIRGASLVSYPMSLGSECMKIELSLELSLHLAVKCAHTHCHKSIPIWTLHIFNVFQENFHGWELEMIPSHVVHHVIYHPLELLVHHL